MGRYVIIEPWKCCEADIHVHEPDFDGIHSYRGSLVSEATVGRVVRVGEISGQLRQRYGHLRWYLEHHNCHAFCEICARVLDYSEDDIATARRQLKDSDLDVSGLDDLEIAWIDYEVRDWLADDARSVKDPWSGKLQLDTRARIVSVLSTT